MINAHFNAHEITNNAQLKAHYLLLIMRNIFTLFLLTMVFTPKHLKLIACGSLLGILDNVPLEGYRTLVANKITQNPIPQKTHKGRARKRRI